MSGVAVNEKVFDQIGDNVIFLRYRIGVSYPRGQAPKSVRGALRFSAPPGAKFEKLYFAPLDSNMRIGKKTDDSYCWSAEYYRDPVLHAAPYGELLLDRRPGFKVTFGRFGEQEPFGFAPKEEKYIITLVTPFAKVRKFNPLYMRVEIPDRSPEYYVLDIDWGNELVIVTLLPIEPEDCPEFLVAV